MRPLGSRKDRSQSNDLLASFPLTSDESPSTPVQVTWPLMVPTKWYAKLGQNVRSNEGVTACWRLVSDLHMVWHTFYISKHPSFSLHICQIGHLRPLRLLPCISPLHRVWGNTQMSGGASIFSRGSFFLHSSNINCFEFCSFLFLDHRSWIVLLPKHPSILGIRLSTGSIGWSDRGDNPWPKRAQPSHSKSFWSYRINFEWKDQVLLSAWLPFRGAVRLTTSLPHIGLIKVIRGKCTLHASLNITCNDCCHSGLKAQRCMATVADALPPVFQEDYMQVYMNAMHRNG